MKRLTFDVLVVGAGPAGLAAAVSAAHHGISVGLIDDNPAPGGQIWRGGPDYATSAQAKYWFERANASPLTMLSRSRVIAPLESGALLVETSSGACKVRFEKLILAPGARERFLPFPGWTLPGVMGAGGLQALVKGGLPIAGKRVVIAGTGPLLLAVAAYLKSKGAQIRLIAEQTSWAQLGSFAAHLLRYPNYIRQAGNLGWSLLGVPFRASCWITRAHGTDRLEAVTVRQHNTIVTEECDYVACGFGLVPNIELPAALCCKIVDEIVRVDDWQQTDLEGVYCAGEATGIGGLELSLAEGQIAGLAATGQMDAAHNIFPARQRARQFAALLADSFALRPELRTLAEADTVVCRCEDVQYNVVKQHANWRSAKLHTRCGMGPCQGRVCGAATAFLFGWTQDSVRPPITAARIASLIKVSEDSHHQSKEQQHES
ncbi:MAG TPA: FAD/NAD(P)-binding oxidoreductase [Ktedonobacteraceae bacterium]|nr:FAD/NAD(P)-binding oxidoreductase [Ktedonobacteraceae bacterium]